MKKATLVVLALGISILTLAQGSEGSDNQSSGDLENIFYFRFAYSMPTNTFIGVDEDVFWDYYNKAGGTFELGQIFMLNSADLADGLRVGINVDYAEFSYNQLTEIDSDIDYTIGFVKLASKVGPSLSYSPVPGLVFDGFFKAKIPWVGGIAMWSTEDLEEVFLAKPGIGFSTGINLRYRFLMFGFEFNSDKMKFESRDYPGEYFGDFNGESDKTPMPSFSFSFGFCF